MGAPRSPQEASRSGGIAFVATKPLQVMVAMVVRDQLGLRGRAALHVVDNFDGADEAVRRLRERSDGWRSVDLHPSRRRALRAAARRNSRVLLDRDVGIGMFAEMLAAKVRWRCELGVYEEGLSSYDPVSELSPRHQAVLRLLGGAAVLGGSRFTSEVWLFWPEKVPEPRREGQRLLRIEERLADYVARHREEIAEIFWPSPELPAGGNRCNVYLPSWEPDLAIARSLAESGGDSVLKLHPHTRTAHPVQDLGFTAVIPARVPAELLLPELSARYVRVDVHHHASSVELYAGCENIVFHSHGDA